MTLYAFNHELARAREVVSEPPLALIRLQWWREVVEGTRRRHEVATPLGEALDAGLLAQADLLALIDAREEEVEPAFETMGDWHGWLLAGAGGLAVAAARLLGAPDPEQARPLGAAYGAAGVLTSAAIFAAQGRCLLPHDVLDTHRLTPEEFIADTEGGQAQAAMAELAQDARSFLAHKPKLPRKAVAAVLPAVFAERDLVRWPEILRPRALGDRLMVLGAALMGRV